MVTRCAGQSRYKHELREGLAQVQLLRVRIRPHRVVVMSKLSHLKNASHWVDYIKDLDEVRARAHTQHSPAHTGRRWAGRDSHRAASWSEHVCESAALAQVYWGEQRDGDAGEHKTALLEFQAAIASGAVHADTMVWYEGREQWCRFREASYLRMAVGVAQMPGICAIVPLQLCRFNVQLAPLPLAFAKWRCDAPGVPRELSTARRGRRDYGGATSAARREVLLRCGCGQGWRAHEGRVCRGQGCGGP